MNKRGNLFEMLLLERGFPSVKRIIKSFERGESQGFPQETVTHIRGQTPARPVLARSQFYRSFDTGSSVFLSSKLVSFRIAISN